VSVSKSHFIGMYIDGITDVVVTEMFFFKKKTDMVPNIDTTNNLYNPWTLQIRQAEQKIVPPPSTQVQRVRIVKKQAYQNSTNQAQASS